jgi:3-isopropylmalate/(R)-2-methylmalate dehydratase small subunit
MGIQGRVWKYGDNVDTDVIMPGRYCHFTDKAELAKHCMEDLDATFVKKVAPGDVLVAGNNFGCGSSREVAPVAIQACGIRAVVARGFARIFFRNCINIGLPVVECAPAVDDLVEGDSVALDLEGGTITNLRSGHRFEFKPLPPEIRAILNAGGLMARIQQKLVDGVYQP